jgi:RNA polymerase sigma-70 factor (ECF subfamily)
MAPTQQESAVAILPSIAALVHWMARYQQAGPEAPPAVIGALSPSLLRFFGTQDLMSREQADDLLQVTWLRIHRVRHTYRPGQPVLPWVYAIARRVRVDGHRRTRRIRAHQIATDMLPEPRPRFESRNFLPAFETLVAVLPKAQREVVTMLKARRAKPGGSSPCHVMHRRLAVKQKASRAYERLRRLLQEEKNELP